MSFVLSSEVRRFGVEATLAHLVGFLGANLALGPVAMWLFPAVERQVGSEITMPMRLFVIGIGFVLLWVACRLLAEGVRRPIVKGPDYSVRNSGDRAPAQEIQARQ